MPRRKALNKVNKAKEERYVEDTKGRLQELMGLVRRHLRGGRGRISPSAAEAHLRDVISIMADFKHHRDIIQVCEKLNRQMISIILEANTESQVPQETKNLRKIRIRSENHKASKSEKPQPVFTHNCNIDLNKLTERFILVKSEQKTSNIQENVTSQGQATKINSNEQISKSNYGESNSYYDISAEVGENIVILQENKSNYNTQSPYDSNQIYLGSTDDTCRDPDYTLSQPKRFKGFIAPMHLTNSVRNYSQNTNGNTQDLTNTENCLETSNLTGATKTYENLGAYTYKNSGTVFNQHNINEIKVNGVQCDTEDEYWLNLKNQKYKGKMILPSENLIEQNVLSRDYTDFIEQSSNEDAGVDTDETICEDFSQLACSQDSNHPSQASASIFSTQLSDHNRMFRKPQQPISVYNNISQHSLLDSRQYQQKEVQNQCLYKQNFIIKNLPTNASTCLNETAPIYRSQQPNELITSAANEAGIYVNINSNNTTHFNANASIPFNQTPEHISFPRNGLIPLLNQNTSMECLQTFNQNTKIVNSISNEHVQQKERKTIVPVLFDCQSIQNNKAQQFKDTPTMNDNTKEKPFNTIKKIKTKKPFDNTKNKKKDTSENKLNKRKKNTNTATKRAQPSKDVRRNDMKNGPLAWLRMIKYVRIVEQDEFIPMTAADGKVCEAD